MKFFWLVFLIFFSFPAWAQEASSPFKSTPYPLPRFVSLASDEVFVRAGPGEKYPIKWVFKKRGLPVEVILEFEVWRKIRDHDGAEGWVHQTLLSGRRTGIIQGEGLISIHAGPKQGSRIIAKAQAGVIAKLKECDARACRAELSGYKGWISKENIWGVYAPETFD